MNLISCETCGIVLDKDNISVPEMHDDEGNIISSNTVWEGRAYHPAVSCPCCEGVIVLRIY